MTSGNHHDTSAAAAVLDRARGFRRDADMAEAHLLAEVLAWTELHITQDPDSAETWGDTPVLLGGQGCPWVREFTITELSSALHLSAASGHALVAEVMELAFRLPRLWGKVQAGRVQAWRARRIARLTGTLSLEAASFVDRQVAGFAHRMGQAAVEHLVEEAIGRFMPDLARKQREQAADRRHFTVHDDQVSFEGTCRVDAELDLTDALDLDAAIGHVAGELGQLGNTLPLDQRRALAAGELARAQYTFTYGLNRASPELVEPELVSQRTPSRVPTDAASETNTASGIETLDVPSDAAETADTANDTATTAVREVTAANPDPGRFGRRDLVLYAHLPVHTPTGTANTGAGIDPDAPVTLEGHGGGLVTLGTLREWLHISGNVTVTIRPVIDLNADLTSNGRFAPPLIREQIGLRGRTCAAPYCTRPARHLDLDHVDPWTDPDTGSPPGDGDPPEPQTRSHNLAPLCRHHHRAKTLTGWCYEMLTPGVFSWTSPHGLRFLTFAGQTLDLE